MIHYLTTAPHQYTVGDYLKSWAGPSHPRIKILPYEVLPTILPRGTYIFSDLEPHQLRRQRHGDLARSDTRQTAIQIVEVPERTRRECVVHRAFVEVLERLGMHAESLEERGSIQRVHVGSMRFMRRAPRRHR